MIRYYEGPAMKELYPNKNFIFVQDSAPFYRTNTVQCFFREELKSRFVANIEWSPLLLTVAQKCSVKKVFSDVLQNSQENNCIRVSF